MIKIPVKAIEKVAGELAEKRTQTADVENSEKRDQYKNTLHQWLTRLDVEFDEDANVAAIETLNGVIVLAGHHDGLTAKKHCSHPECDRLAMYVRTVKDTVELLAYIESPPEMCEPHHNQGVQDAFDGMEVDRKTRLYDIIEEIAREAAGVAVLDELESRGLA